MVIKTCSDNENFCDSDENSDYMYNYIKKILEEVGPRAPGSEEERKAAELVKKDMLELGCDEAEIEEFKIYPRAFLGWFRVTAVGWVIIFLLYVAFQFSVPILGTIFALLGALFCALIIYKQFGKYEDFMPKFLPYKQKTSQNTLGIIKPSGEVTKRVVVSGHIDSAFTFNLIEHTRQGYAYVLTGAILGFALTGLGLIADLILQIGGLDQSQVSIVLSWAGLVFPGLMFFIMYVLGMSEKILTGALSIKHPIFHILMGYQMFYGVLMDIIFWNRIHNDPTLFTSVFLIFCQCIPIIIGMFFYLDTKAVPGAIDNLTGVAAAMCVGKIINDFKKHQPELAPKHTEVVIAIVGSEEVGLRGSEHFARQHADEYNKIDTTCVNFESLAESRGITVYDEELTTNTKMTPEVYNLVVEACEQIGVPCRLGKMPSIAGGTDATGLIKGGLKATTIEGLRYKDYLSFYHTSRDNLSGINKVRKSWKDIGPNWHNRNVRAAMELGVNAVVKYIELKDLE